MNIKQLEKEIIQGRRLKREDDLSFFLDTDLKILCESANNIREKLCGEKVELCSIINGVSGKCSEDCKFCAQSSHYKTEINKYSFLDSNTIIDDCEKHASKGVHRYSIVTAGRNLKPDDLKSACSAYEKMNKKCNINLCASHGLLSESDFVSLKKAGVTMYHANIETSKRHFPNVCSTHTYDDKIKTINLARKIGFKICSGCILGIGEDFQDRINMAISLSELKVESIPINALVPIKSTPYENFKTISEEDLLRTIAMFRFINPTSKIRLAAGRNLMKESGKKAFLSGVNATITGDLLTTSGNNIEEDKKMLKDLGFKL